MKFPWRSAAWMGGLAMALALTGCQQENSPQTGGPEAATSASDIPVNEVVLKVEGMT